MLAPVVFTSVVGMGELFGPEVRRCFGTPTWTSSQTPQVWLDHQVTEQDGGLLFNWDVVEELFEAGVVDAMFHAYRHLLDWLVDPACSWDGPVPPLLPRTQAVVREAVNATAAPLPAGLLHDDFFVRAAASPDAVGVAWGERDRRTYGELRDGALRIGALLERHGVRPGDAVAVTLPRGPDQIAAVLGVLAAGAAYVPVGPDQPPRRRAEAYASARAAVVLTEFGAAPEWTGGAEAVPVHHARGVAPLPAPLRVPAESLAYVIFTSGSTGAPKGVEISHRAALNTIDDVNSRFGVGAGDAVLAVSALDFDLSVYDIFGLLSAGGTVVVPDEADRREARRWGELVRRWKVTVWNSVPALLDMLLVAAGRPEAPSLRLALVSGDWVGLDLPPRLAAACPAARFVALGGATEAAIWSNSFEVEAVPPHWRSIPYGRPLRNQAYRVADLRGRDCPDWVPGELWIGGAGLADGYRGDPARTAERFVTHEGRRWYRTGDLGRYWPDATLEFLGRRDLQVKVRGHRVELGEIEAALRSHPDVGAAAAAVTGGPARRIAAAVVGRAGALDPEQLQSFLAERLPPYLLPGGLAVLDELPLTSNGKIDRAALARLVEVPEPEPGDELPRGPIESGLARVWSELLGVAEVPRNRSFFALGGDSLIATRMVESLRDRFGVGVSLRRLFEAPTVAELAAVVASGRRELEEAEEGVV
jgi:amino acid adenylation domain-containing protein